MNADEILRYVVITVLADIIISPDPRPGSNLKPNGFKEEKLAFKLNLISWEIARTKKWIRSPYPPFDCLSHRRLYSNCAIATATLICHSLSRGLATCAHRRAAARQQRRQSVERRAVPTARSHGCELFQESLLDGRGAWRER